jgi:hypothetical protein
VDGARELQTVHRSRHLDICKDDADIFASFQASDCFVGITARGQKTETAEKTEKSRICASPA